MSVEIVGTACFALAIVHTFSVKQFQEFAHAFREDSVARNVFHLLGEVEVVFGLWAGVFMLYFGLERGFHEAVHHVEAMSFTEPAFVFVAMAVCSARPILKFAARVVAIVARVLPINRSVGFYYVTLTVGPLLGSLITEPAAMTVTAYILLERYYQHRLSPMLMYATIGVLFVNVSIGGTLTNFAAPPVLMVASTWSWDSLFMLEHFGWKGALACGLSTFCVTTLFFRELSNVPFPEETEASEGPRTPAWVTTLHLVFLALIVASSHYTIVFMWLFLFFLGLVNVTREYQEELKLREGLLVAFFLGGIVILGPSQRWWLQPTLAQLNATMLYFGAMGLTALTDNAALTFLGSQIDLSEPERYALVAGSVVGGGLTVIANSPNPAGFGILNRAFGADGLDPLRLFLAALGPTAIAALCFWAL